MAGREAGGSSGGNPPPRLAVGEGWLRSLLKNTADVVTVLDADNAILYDSPAIRRVFGYAPGERVGKSGFDYVHPDDRERTEEAFAEPLRESSVDAPLGYRMRRKDGSWRYVEATRTNLLDDPAVGGVVVVYRDATERKEAEEALKEGEEKYRSIFENAAEGIYQATPDGRLIDANPALARLFGYASVEEMVGTMTDVKRGYVDPDRREEFVRLIGENGAVSGFEYRVYRKDGSVAWVSENARAVRSKGGALHHYEGFLEDVTDRKEVEEALRESEERFRALVQNVSDMISVLNPDGTIRYVSPSVERVLGYRPEERVGADAFGGETHPDDAEEMRGAFARGLGRPGGVSETLGFRVRHADGSWRHLEAVAANRLDHPAVRGIVVNARDVTERKEAERRLREAEENQRRRARELELLHRVRTALSRELDPREVLRAVVEAVASAYGYTLVSAYLLEGEDPDRELVMQHQVGYRSVLRRIPMTRGVMARTARTGEPVLLKDAHGDPDFLDAIQGIVSEVCVPLLDGGNVAGTLNVESTGGTALTEEDLRLVVALGEHVGIALGRARLHARVRESEERHRSVVENVKEVIFQTDAEGHWTFLNPAWEEVTGFPVEESLGENSLDYVHPEDRERNTEEFRPLMEREKDHCRHEVRYLTEGGGSRWVEVYARLTLGPDGAVLGTSGTLNDVTERKEAEAALRESEERFRALVQNASDIVTVLDAGGAIRYESPSVERVLGHRPEELVGKDALEYVHPEDAGRVRDRLRRREAAGAGVGSPVEYRIRHADGSWRCVESIATNLLSDPRVGGIVVNTRDVTERKEAEGALRESEERYRRLVESSPEAIAVHDGREVLYANPAAARLFGAGDPSGLIGGEVISFVHPDYRGVVASRVRAVLEGGEGTPLLEERYLRLDGGVVDAEVAGEPITYAGKAAVQVVLRDVTGRKRMEEELRHRAAHDPLTGLPNRRLLMERLRHALGRRGREVALLFLDLDGFKVVNDSLGHDAGDLLLIAAGRRIGGALRPSDTVARLGGDEFVVLLEDTGPEGAARAAGRVLAALEAPFAVDDHELRVSASIGVTVGGGGCVAGPEELLREADLAMYRAKEQGKARHAVYDPAMDARARERLALRGGLWRALERGEFALRYQPVVSLENGDVVGLEALLRWEHPERGTLRPAEFLAEAEDAGLAGPLFSLALGEACRLSAGLTREGNAPGHAPPWVSVNLSPLRLRDLGLPEEVTGALSEAGVAPGRLVLEVTEDAAVEGGSEAEATLGRLEGLGVGVAIDDFGTGHSSLSHLERLPADFLKLDRAFVANLSESRRKAAMVRGIVDLAHALSLAVVAEGVETEAQRDALREAGCDLAQGHLFAKPLSAGEAASLVAQGYYY